MTTKKRVGILISGRGSNMTALIEAARAPAYPAEIACVLCNRPGAEGLARAEAQGVPTRVIDHTTCASREAFELSSMRRFCCSAWTSSPAPASCA